MSAPLLHATAIRIGATGIILVGPSGCGKSSMALSLMATARRTGHHAALIGDDVVVIDVGNGLPFARSTGRMEGRIEIRGSGIGRVAFAPETTIDWAVMPVEVTSANRMPEEGLRFTLPAVASGGSLSVPLLAIDRRALDPFAVLEAMIPGFPG